jgi:hypothetical protein
MKSVFSTATILLMITSAHAETKVIGWDRPVALSTQNSEIINGSYINQLPAQKIDNREIQCLTTKKIDESKPASLTLNYDIKSLKLKSSTAGHAVFEALDEKGLTLTKLICGYHTLKNGQPLAVAHETPLTESELKAYLSSYDSNRIVEKMFSSINSLNGPFGHKDWEKISIDIMPYVLGKYAGERIDKRARTDWAKVSIDILPSLLGQYLDKKVAERSWKPNGEVLEPSHEAPIKLTDEEKASFYPRRDNESLSEHLERLEFIQNFTSTR